MRRSISALLLLVPLVAQSLPPGLPMRAEDRAALVRSITTEIRFADGAMQRNRGSGFVIGDRFYTAYHNLHALPGVVVHYRILLGGIPVQPLDVDVNHDLAVFALPGTLCPTWCNDLELEESGLGLNTVTWLEQAGVDPHWQRARVRNVAFKGVPEPGRDGCDANLIVEIESAFQPGDSGGPVFDPISGTIVGLIQGSFETSDGVSTGYFKPVRCIRQRLTDAAD